MLRATQFHEFPAQLLERMPRSPVVPVPRMWSQPVAAREVAGALVEAALDQPAGRLPDLAGPRVERMEDLVRQLLKARGRRRLILPIRVPGKAGRAMAEGSLIATRNGLRGNLTFDQWLASEDGREALTTALRATSSRANLQPNGCRCVGRRGVLRGTRPTAFSMRSSDSTRRDILARAIQREQSVSALARHYEISLTAVQKHVTVLERAALDQQAEKREGATRGCQPGHATSGEHAARGL